MKYHPLQSDKKSVDLLSSLFRESMERKGLLPKNPWRAKKTEAWLEKLGCRMHPCYSPGCLFPERTDLSKYLFVYMACPKAKTKIRGRRIVYMKIEIPHELADKIVAFGFLP